MSTWPRSNHGNYDTDPTGVSEEASAAEYRLGTMTLEGDRVQLQLSEEITDRDANALPDEAVQETTRTIVCVFSTAECDGMQPR